MFLTEPPRTAYDLHFNLLGISVRVSPFFWLAAFLLGFGISQSKPDLVLLWIVAVFLSILVHEMGHALAFRRYGIGSRIVLYHFGGLAIPETTKSFGVASARLDPKSQIVISAAGPAAQLGLAAVVVILVRLSNHAVPPVPFVPSALLGLSNNPLPNFHLMVLVWFLLLPSIFWALLNLLPVYPLDGGQIARELFLLFNIRDGIRYSLMLSIGTGGLVGLYALTHDQPFMGIMFLLLAYSSYSMLQAFTGGGFGGYGGGRPW